MFESCHWSLWVLFYWCETCLNQWLRKMFLELSSVLDRVKTVGQSLLVMAAVSFHFQCPLWNHEGSHWFEVRSCMADSSSESSDQLGNPTLAIRSTDNFQCLLELHSQRAEALWLLAWKRRSFLAVVYAWYSKLLLSEKGPEGYWRLHPYLHSMREPLS